MDRIIFFHWINHSTSQSVINSSIFGFGDFIQGLALLVIVYTITDIRYRFRTAITPIPLFGITFFSIAFIGLGTLLTDVWFSEHWLIPDFLSNQSILQGVFGFLFLLIVLIWVYFAFIRPPIFSKKNYRKYATELYKVILKGSEKELSVIADELGRSADSLVNYSKQNPSQLLNDDNTEIKKYKPNINDYAYDVLLLIGNRKLCRHIVESAPITAIKFFNSMKTLDKYKIPIGQFARNISTEAIINKDSILHHEDEGYSSGLIGYLKPFSNTLYGNYKLIKSLSSDLQSPFDIDYEIYKSWNADLYKIYSKVVLITFENYLETDDWYSNPKNLYNAFALVQSSCNDIYKLNDVSLDYYSTDIFKRLQNAVQFIKHAIDILHEQNTPTPTILRIHNDYKYTDFYDYIAILMFNIILNAASVIAPADKCWNIHHNIIWDQFFELSESKKAQAIVQFKLRRLLYNEILRLEKSPNFKSAKILGFCLNVMGLKLTDKEGFTKPYFSLHKVVLSWTKKQYLHLKNIQPNVANSSLLGSISFDEKNNRLVKTWVIGLDLEAPKDYLELLKDSKDINNVNNK